jgi:hypothetical protein
LSEGTQDSADVIAELQAKALAVELLAKKGAAANSNATIGVMISYLFACKSREVRMNL